MSRTYIRYSIHEQSLQGLYVVFDEKLGEEVSEALPYVEARQALALYLAGDKPKKAVELDAQQSDDNVWVI